MTVHRPHPLSDTNPITGKPDDSWAAYGLKAPDDPDAVLFDGCDRCVEHARTLTSLDEGHLRRLWLRHMRLPESHLTHTERLALETLRPMLLVVEMATRIPVRTLIEAGVDLIPLTKENR
jgi:hypothetical protein